MEMNPRENKELQEKIERFKALVQEVGTHPMILMRGIEGLDKHLSSLSNIQMTSEEKKALLEKAEEIKTLAMEFGRYPTVRENAMEELKKRQSATS